MKKHSAAITPGVARIEFLPAIDPGAYETREELMRACRAEIIEALPEEMRPAAS
jgi:1-acyl-sn-glycerol-3-phosphate acyltransferase